MQWLRYGTLAICVGIALSVLSVSIHTFWIASQTDPPGLGQKIMDLQLLVVILLGVTALYTVVFLLAPSMSEQIIRRLAEQSVKAVKTQMLAGASELRELKDEIRRIVSGLSKAAPENRAEMSAPPRAALDSPQTPAAPGAPAPTTGREYLHLSSRVRVLNNELVLVYQALARLCMAQDPAAAKTYLTQALALNANPDAAGEIHYELACLHARTGELGEAAIEIQTAFMSKPRELGPKLAKDTEQGGPLYELASLEPYKRLLDDLLMEVSVA